MKEEAALYAFGGIACMSAACGKFVFTTYIHEIELKNNDVCMMYIYLHIYIYIYCTGSSVRITWKM